MCITQALEVYTREYSYIKGLKPGTIKNYRMAVVSFVKVHGDIDIEKITLEHIYEWRQHCDSQNMSTSVVNSYLGKFKLLLRFFSRRMSVSLHPDDISLPKIKRKLPQLLTDDEVNAMYLACNSDRDRLAVYLLYSTGCRLEELCTIRMSGIEEDKILINGKGDKERYIFLDEHARKLLKSYTYSKYRSEWLFPSNQDHTQYISTFAIRMVIKKVALKGGVNRNVTPHLFRHTYATNLLRSGCDIRYIQSLLGHAYITSTQIYTQVSNDELKQIYIKHTAKFENVHEVSDYKVNEERLAWL